MEEVMMQSQITTTDKAGNVIVDIESLIQLSDKCSGSPKVSKVLSRKGSSRMERRSCEEQEADDASRKFAGKVVSSDQPRHPFSPNKALPAASTASSCLVDSLDGRGKRFSRFTTINPRRIMLLFASMSSMGSMILIYFTLAINRRGGA